MSVAVYAQFGGPPPKEYTPAADARDLKSVLFNWPWHMVMLRGIEEHELAVTLEYRGEGTIQVQRSALCDHTYKATKRAGELGKSGYRVSNAYQFEGSRTQIECKLPNGQMYKHRGRQRQVRLGMKTRPGAGLVPGEGTAKPMPDKRDERLIVFTRARKAREGSPGGRRNRFDEDVPQPRRIAKGGQGEDPRHVGSLGR